MAEVGGTRVAHLVQPPCSSKVILEHKPFTRAGKILIDNRKNSSKCLQAVKITMTLNFNSQSYSKSPQRAEVAFLELSSQFWGDLSTKCWVCLTWNGREHKWWHRKAFSPLCVYTRIYIFLYIYIYL